MALLIALLFLGATAQCNAVCVQPEKHLPPCHRHAAACTKAPLTAERTASATIPVPAITFLPASFLPAAAVFQLPRFFTSPPSSAFKRIVLLI